MVQVLRRGGWVFYLGEDYQELDPHKCGKWMYFFADLNRAEDLCRIAVEEGVVVESKHTDALNGVCCFYLNGDNAKSHRRTLEFFLAHDMIRKTKAGKYFNISFKYDDQTLSGEYGRDFRGQIKLNQFMDLETGAWLI